ncbi:4937_t:CDS:2 [Acaulospora morrowiae]|uniref:4937_t:CDS:1 n=1 Tax=Acaulospora morrowiae TaxID=94023 RepID=A0A9N8Z504_9GLOM|nr:4937_t:CDS:2 [Acaulospora morrowiae]
MLMRLSGEDPSDWVLEFKRFVIASQINIIADAGGVVGRAEAYNLAISCIIGEAKTWFENKIKNRNWQCDNILDEALVVRNNVGSDNTITGANIIPVGTWDEDWSIAGGHPAPIETLSPANYANAGADNSIVALEMTFGQFLYCLEYLYPMVEAQKNLLFFGQIVQGDMSILEDNITKALVEAEKFSLLQGNFPFPPSGGQENQITLSQDNFKKIIASLKGTIAKGQQTLKKPPGPGKRKADDLAINHFLDNVINDTDLLEEAYDYDPIEDLKKQFKDLDINQAKLAQIIHT